MKKLKICFLEEELCLCGGIRRILETANGLVEKGHDVTILVTLKDAKPECNWFKVKAKIKHFLEREEYDVAVINHVPNWLCLNSTIAKLKVYYWLSFEAGYLKQPTWYDAYQQDFFIVANSKWTAEMAELIYGKKPPVVLGGIDNKQFYPVKTEKKYELLCCCPQDRPEKGWFEIQRAAAVLKLPVENFANKNLPQDKLAEEYSKAKIFVAAPYLEGFYYPPLEAMACGVPVVMTDAGGNREYAKDGENCFLVSRNVGEIARAIKKLKENPNLQKKFIKNGFETVKKYTWKKSVNDFEKIIRRAYEEKEI